MHGKAVVGINPSVVSGIQSFVFAFSSPLVPLFFFLAVKLFPFICLKKQRMSLLVERHQR